MKIILNRIITIIKKRFWLVSFIVFLFVCFLLARGFEKEKKVQNLNLSKQEESKYTNVLTTDKSVVSGKLINTKELNDNVSVIKSFFEYCNNNKIELAYKLLSDECKEELYGTLEDFQNNYYNVVFGNRNKNFIVENWYQNIYSVKINDDILASGKYSEDNEIKEYVTVVENNKGDIRLNINGFIENKRIGKSVNENGINVDVLNLKRYMDYSEYEFEITNNTDNNILLSDLYYENSMYLQDANGLKYDSYYHELSQQQLKLDAKSKKKIKIKYYDKYSSSKKINKIVFENVILNYDLYKEKYDSKEGYRDYSSIIIDLD